MSAIFCDTICLQHGLYIAKDKSSLMRTRPRLFVNGVGVQFSQFSYKYPKIKTLGPETTAKIICKCGDTIMI